MTTMKMVVLLLTMTMKSSLITDNNYDTGNKGTNNDVNNEVYESHYSI